MKKKVKNEESDLGDETEVKSKVCNTKSGLCDDHNIASAELLKKAGQPQNVPTNQRPPLPATPAQQPAAAAVPSHIQPAITNKTTALPKTSAEVGDQSVLPTNLASIDAQADRAHTPIHGTQTKTDASDPQTKPTQKPNDTAKEPSQNMGVDVDKTLPVSMNQGQPSVMPKTCMPLNQKPKSPSNKESKTPKKHAKADDPPTTATQMTKTETSSKKSAKKMDKSAKKKNTPKSPVAESPTQDAVHIALFSELRLYGAKLLAIINPLASVPLNPLAG
ncbi:hypothetical protein AAVH_00252 [Aphelenchoides avenae]|nr:hypothetical protein AAVH_00252 [Aphelenchus avenae]